MSQELWIVPTLAAGVTAAVSIRTAAPASSTATVAVGASLVAIMAAVAYLYSPLPNRTTIGGVGDGAGYWGFARDEDE